MRLARLRWRPSRELIWLTLIVLAAALLRARGIGFGLPALYDPDEPIFFLTALKLLRGLTLNPGWFGHPGTTTIYALALIYVLELAIGLLTGRFGEVADFGRAIYADPSVIVLPGRWFIVACGLLTIVLTYLLARRLFGARAGLLAAALLAIEPIHIRYSQIIRTDMHETVFLLLCILATVNIARRGWRRDYVWAGVWLGIACATKWPAATAIVPIISASLYRMARSGNRGEPLILLALVGPVALAALLVASPYLLLDFGTVMTNLSAEARNHHPGSTGYGFWGNAGWYVFHPLRDAIGAPGIILALFGTVIAARRSTPFAVAVTPMMAVSFLAICVQALIWERWIVPLLPFVTVALAVGLDTLAVRVKRWWVTLLLVATVAAPMIVVGEAMARERAHDTRAQASAWARAHFAPGSTVVVEQLSFDLLGTGWRFLFPVGDAGCVDVAANLRAKIPYSTVERWRGGRPVIDLGTIAPRTFATCRADWAIIVDYDRYLLEPASYPDELRLYRAFIARGAIAATFRPTSGQVGGPVVRIVRFDPRASGWQSLASARR